MESISKMFQSHPYIFTMLVGSLGSTAVGLVQALRSKTVTTKVENLEISGAEMDKLKEMVIEAIKEAGKEVTE